MERGNSSRSRYTKLEPISAYITPSFWKPLDHTNKEIRVFSLIPKDDGDTTVCNYKLETMSLYDNPNYDAISYAWGLADDMEMIYINNVRWNIPVTLGMCLDKLRDHAPQRSLWCDYLCINQFDATEKSRQIQLMDEIFANASTVRVWLQSPQGHDKMRYAMQLIKGEKSWNSTVEDVHRVAEFCSDPWWSRLWVLQEVALAREVIFHHPCGFIWSEEYLRFGQDNIKPLLKIINGHNSIGVEINHFVDVFQKYWDFRQLRYMFNSNSNDEPVEKLLDSLIMSRTRLVTDPKDRIFGLLALCNRMLQRSILQVNYDQALEKIYAIFTYRFLKTTNSWLILSQAAVHHNKLLTLPSWAPDWSSHYNFKAQINRRVMNVKFEAGTIRQFYMRLHDDYTLRLRIYRIDRIGYLGLPFHNQTNPKNMHTCLTSWEEFCERKFPSKRFPYKNSEDFWQAYMKTVFNDFFADSFDNYIPCEDRVDIIYQNMKKKLQDGIWDITTSSLLRAASKRRLILSETGYVGLVPAETKLGDLISIFPGSPLPFILRRVDSPLKSHDSYILIGDCYIHGIMRGEFFRGRKPVEYEEILLR